MKTMRLATWVLAAVPPVLLALCWGGLPDRVPVHWGLDGAVTYGARWELVVPALLPILFFCVVFQLILRRFSRFQLQKIAVGFLYTFIGLALFLTGVNVGFMPAGHYLGVQMAQMEQSWHIIPLSMVIGYFIVTAEPAVHVLN